MKKNINKIKALNLLQSGISICVWILLLFVSPMAGFCLSIFPGTVSSVWANNIAIVVHRDVAEDNLDMVQVRRILLGNRQYWSQSQRITLLVPAATIPGRDVLLRTIYEMTDAQYRHYWIAKVFRAESTVAPQPFFSKEMAIKLIDSIPGAIAIVDASEIPEGLKILVEIYRKTTRGKNRIWNHDG